MTNKEKYKQAFSGLRISDETNLETTKKAYADKKKKLYRMAAGFAACVVLFTASGTAYAADIGGIRSIIKVWIQGEQTGATINFGDGTYTMEYTDDEGIKHQQGGGGCEIDDDGSERPLTKEELMDNLNSPEVVYEKDGSVWVYYFEQKINITDKFKDNICYLKLVREDKTLYMTIKYKNGFTTSYNECLNPSLFE